MRDRMDSVRILHYEKSDQARWQSIRTVVAFGLVWVLLGLAGLVTSLVCLGYKGQISAKVGGPFVALLFGPFYWIYFVLLRQQGLYCVV